MPTKFNTKKRQLLFFFALFFSSSLHVYSQSQGITYQAVIIDKKTKEIPGVDIEGNYLPDKPLTVRFTIFNENGNPDYQEEHATRTDEYGMIHLMIGQGIPTSASPSIFSEIDWNGTPKDLRVEINLGESTNTFVEFSLQPLTFVPYAFHRNITATGSLTVDGKATFNGLTEFQDIVVNGVADLNGVLNVNNASPANLSGILNVDGVTDLNNTLRVNNGSATNLSGILNVDGVTDLNNTLRVNNGSATNLTGVLNVDGATDLNNTLNVIGATNLDNTLDVTGVTNLNSTLNVGGTTGLNGQVTISANLGGGAESSYSSYPLRVEGNSQGVAIRLTAPTPDNGNNFITFFNSSGGAVGRIEGETSGEVASDPEFIYQEAILIAEEVKAGVAVGLAAIPVVVAGVGASAGPCGACIAMAAADLVLATANLVAFNVFAYENLGVTYQSGSADYAEWLERYDPNEQISAGDIVGVNGGKISKYTYNSQQYMVISTKPAILGNMPMDGKEKLYEKVAFMGQIPVKVRGITLSGDYILPSGLNDGTGVAVSPNDIAAKQYREIVGVAWSSALIDKGISVVNMAIGLNANDVANLAVQQEKKINDLENKLSTLEQRFLALENGTVYKPNEAAAKISAPEKEMTRYEVLASYMPSELSDETMEEAMLYLQKQYKAQGINVEDHPALNRLFTDATYKTEIIKKTQENYKLYYQRLLIAAKNKN